MEIYRKSFPTKYQLCAYLFEDIFWVDGNEHTKFLSIKQIKCENILIIFLVLSFYPSNIQMGAQRPFVNIIIEMKSIHKSQIRFLNLYKSMNVINRTISGQPHNISPLKTTFDVCCIKRYKSNRIIFCLVQFIMYVSIYL